PFHAIRKRAHNQLGERADEPHQRKGQKAQDGHSLVADNIRKENPQLLPAGGLSFRPAARGGDGLRSGAHWLNLAAGVSSAGVSPRNSSKFRWSDWWPFTCGFHRAPMVILYPPAGCWSGVKYIIKPFSGRCSY